MKGRSRDSSCKLQALDLIVENSLAMRSKVLVFSQYVETLRWIQPRIVGGSPLIFHGGLSENERVETLASFRGAGNTEVLLISLTAGSVGLNIQEADVVVLFDRWWNPAIEEQAVRRAHRFGRTRPVHAFKFIVRNTVEERIDEILTWKQGLFDTYVEGLSTRPDGAVDESHLRWILDMDPVSRTPLAHREESHE